MALTIALANTLEARTIIRNAAKAVGVNLRGLQTYTEMSELGMRRIAFMGYSCSKPAFEKAAVAINAEFLRQGFDNTVVVTESAGGHYMTKNCYLRCKAVAAP